MEGFLEKVEECYINIHRTHDKLKNNAMHVSPDVLVLAVLEAKGVITREEQEALKEYVLHG